MHELSMADSMVNAILNTAKSNDAIEIKEATLEIGELTMLNPEQLKFMIGVLSKDTLLENTKMNINMLPIKIECQNCDYKGETKTDDEMNHLLAAAKCPKCNDTNVKVIQGRECNVKTIKIEREDDA
ncbi:MAG: hydrogenase maturation nickel metallochaperone HypA [Methanobacteriaceae archaeon]|nr:hydrogenase maturation nickel metallochaperone HypA [Methanobacteriaceae archaeon]